MHVEQIKEKEKCCSHLWYAGTGLVIVISHGIGVYIESGPCLLAPGNKIR